MIQVPLPVTIKGSKRTPKLVEYPHNVIYVNGGLLSRPACTRVYSVTPRKPRGQFIWDGDLYSVWGNDLYRGVGPTQNRIGSIAGNAKIRTAKGYNGVAIATSSVEYFFDGTLTVLNDPDLPTCADVTRIDGRFVWTPVDGGPVVYSDINDAGNIDALSFFDAETLPDINKATVNIKNDLFVFGADSIERFRNVGTPTLPFVRVNNSINSVGYVGGLIETRDSFMFLGKDKDGGNQFYVYANGTAVPISTDSVNEQLENDYTQEQLAECEGQRFNWHGADCYVFSLPGRDYVFSGSNWGYFTSDTDGVGQIRDWGFRGARFFDNEWYIQHEDGLYKFTNDNKDSLGHFSRGFRTYVRDGIESVKTLARVELSLAQFVGRGSVGLSLSRDGVVWSDPMFRETGGAYDNKLVFAPLGGLGKYDGYIGIEIYANTDTPFHIDNMVIM